MRRRWPVERIHASVFEPKDAVTIDDNHAGPNFHLFFRGFLKTESLRKQPFRVGDHSKRDLLTGQLRFDNIILNFFYALRIDKNQLGIVFCKVTVLVAQLTQLLEAEWSPVADPTPTHNDKNILLAFEVR